MSAPMVETYRSGRPSANMNVHVNPTTAPPPARNTLKPHRSSVAPIPLSPNSSTFPRRSPVPPPAVQQPISPRYPQPATDYTRQPIVPHKHTPSPPPPYMASPPPGYGAPQYATYMQPATEIRRNSSNATSTSSNSGSGGNVRRSSSNRASSASTVGPGGYSYVMRLRAKVAVSWCDRGQAEDPRILAAMRAAKERAEREVALPPSGAHHHHHASARAGGMMMGGAAATTQLQHQPDGGSSSFTSGVARKIRHHGGAPKASKYAGGNLVGAGVPMRLSANEVDDDDDVPDDDAAQPGRDDDWGMDASFYGALPSQQQRFDEAPPLPQKVLQIHQHRRSDSGGRGAGSLAAHAAAPPRLGLVVPPEDSPDEGQSPEATPVASTFAQREYYLQQQAAARQQQRHAGAGDPEERRREEELKRRGSVDDRAMTMSGVRLYVANPDVDD